MSGIIMRLAFIGGIAVYFGMLLYLLRKRALSIKFSILWFIVGGVMLALIIFPGLLTAIANALGFEVASNALFSVLFLLILLIILSLSSAVSRFNRQISELAQKIALLENELKDKK